ncbi:MAG: phosphoglycolate phosphatase, bacterial [Gammaproteobacteria bacterium]|nr:MAG: phosphoglycolate phosphatase, bacterial [Gammaproteobacteria bacterium]
MLPPAAGGVNGSPAVLRLFLFDLDGTLVDTAPDLAAVVNAMRTARGLPPRPLEALRPAVSRGARALLRRAFDPPPDGAELEALRAELLERYAAAPARAARLFPGLDGVLARLEAAGLPWGVVTNKPQDLAAAVLDALDLARRCAVLIGGDRLKRPKPDPEGLQSACRQCAVPPAQAVYLGDDRRDVEAARAAGLAALVAAWGYREAEDDPCRWGADAIIADAEALHAWLDPRLP